jgi:hypothetical protein
VRLRGEFSSLRSLRSLRLIFLLDLVYLQRDNVRHGIEIGVAVKEKQIMFHRSLGDNTIYGTPDGHALSPTFEIYSGGSGKRIDWILRVIKTLSF